jgi:peptidoglycan/LPS O-acetylase OafA/YrhL
MWFTAVIGKGNYGVQFFYVASAFTLFLSLEQRSHLDQRPVLFFFLRRFFRIAPMFWAAIIFYLLFDGLGPRATSPLGIGLPHILSTALFMHGWYPTTINSVVPGGWSIAVEMTFYLSVPIFFFHAKSIARLVPIFALLLVVSRLASWAVKHWLWSAMDPIFHDCVSDFAYYWLPAQMPVFCVGFILFLIAQRRLAIGPGATPTDRRWGNLLLIVAALLSGLLVLFQPPMAFIGYAVVAAVVALSLAFHPNVLLVNRLTRYAGKVSYSGYLIHFAIVETLRDLSVWSRTAQTLPALLQYLVFAIVAMVLTLGISTVTYKLIEEPGRNIGRRIIHRLDAPRSGGLEPS